MVTGKDGGVKHIHATRASCGFYDTDAAITSLPLQRLKTGSLADEHGPKWARTSGKVSEPKGRTFDSSQAHSRATAKSAFFVALNPIPLDSNSFNCSFSISANNSRDLRCLLHESISTENYRHAVARCYPPKFLLFVVQGSVQLRVL
jgi:hypothetical protein